MPRITTITNQKGGIGKTTTAHALAAGLKKKGYSVLLIDTDSQANLSDTAGADTRGAGLNELIETAITAPQTLTPIIEAAIQHRDIDIIAATDALDGVEIAIAEAPEAKRAYILKTIISRIPDRYSHIIIDTPPTLGLMTINALTACNDVIIPLKAEVYALRGFAKLESTIQKTRAAYNPLLSVAGLLITMYSDRTILARSLYQDIHRQAERLHTHVYSTYIRQGIAIGEAQTLQQSIFDYAPTSKPAADYTAFIEEYINQER